MFLVLESGDRVGPDNTLDNGRIRVAAVGVKIDGFLFLNKLTPAKSLGANLILGKEGKFIGLEISKVGVDIMFMRPLSSKSLTFYISEA